MHTHRYSKVTPTCCIHMKVGSRSEVVRYPESITEFHWAVEIWPGIFLKSPTLLIGRCTCHALNEGEGWMMHANKVRPTAVMKQTPCQ